MVHATQSQLYGGKSLAGGYQSSCGFAQPSSFFCNSSSEEGPASFFLPLIRRALGDDPNYHLVYTVNMH